MFMRLIRTLWAGLTSASSSASRWGGNVASGSPEQRELGVCFGSASLTLLMLQFATGICLAMVYVPSADEAWNSLQVLNQQQTFGWYLRALHGWGSNFMVAMVLVHMIQVFLFGAFKFPELT